MQNILFWLDFAVVWISNSEPLWISVLRGKEIAFREADQDEAAPSGANG